MLSQEPQCCVVVGCPVIHEETCRKKGFKFEPKNKRFKTTHTISGLCKGHYEKKRKKQPLWTDAQLAEDADRECEVRHTKAGTCKLRLRFTVSRISRKGFATYVREDSQNIWEFQSRTGSGKNNLPISVDIFSKRCSSTHS